jgi:hypothetical protein
MRSFELRLAFSRAAVTVVDGADTIALHRPAYPFCTSPIRSEPDGSQLIA